MKLAACHHYHRSRSAAYKCGEKMMKRMIARARGGGDQ
jgi:hypothetical protein